MAKKIWEEPIDKNVDWGGDNSTNNLPVSGKMVQKFIKDSLDSKAGIFHYDTANNRYIVFSDTISKDEYLSDPTQTHLIIGTFDAPFNYTAEITLTSAVYNAVFLSSVGNYIDFTFDIKNKQGASTGENVTVTYTFIRNSTKQVVKETRKYGDSVHFNVDKYLGEGTNTIIVGITGQTSLAATTVAITYQVVNLVLTDEYDISKSYNLSNGSKKVEVPFSVSGYGTKIVEWYLDGVKIPFVKVEDEIVDISADRTKYIEIANLQQGTHSLQFRAYTVVNGEQFYTDTMYRDIIIYTGADSNVILGVAVTVPRQYGVLGANDHVAIYDMVQYVPYTLRFATYSPSNAANTEVVISLDGKEMGKVGSVNNIENRFVVTPSTAGTKTLKLSTLSVTKEYQTIIKETDMDIAEIDSGLVLNFTAEGKTYNSPDREYWTDGVHNAVLSGFNWNATSGWFDGRLEMNVGSSIQFDYAPLSGNPTNTGKTIEIEWASKNVTNDDAIICDLRGDNGVGILITATKVSMKSSDGVVVETEYKSDENVRIGFVINQSSGTTNQRLSFIYANGIVSRGEKWAQADSYTSDKLMKFTATKEAEVSLKSIRIYDTALSSDNMLNNYVLYRDTVSQMLEVYDRNDVYEEGTTTFSPDKMMGRLPVMIVTGDIPVLENTSDKDTQIIVDIEYYNMQDTSKSFMMKNAAMRPQGTSSMGYPKKNFRIYTQKVENTEVYDADGKLIENKLYSFKDGAQPVNCWCLKADYAESSGTHNTGIARLWNEALMNAQIEGEYVCRTEAQKAAIAANYEYDVRTTIDGFPILLFYRPSANDDIIFIGKYNFNNDKSTESVFGFTGIPGFNNEKMQCWEILNNGNALALFTSTEGFDTGWSEAFESRYPDTKTPYTGDLKAFCEWMSTVTLEDFKTQKWEHLNMYMIAAYWVYLMRHAAADQFVKNAMLTSEDGQHFYFILYDNDTINGLINTGRLRISPTDDRQTVDETGSYVFAGHDSRLWNMLENDKEFISIVSAVDNALYSAGISYANTIKIFDEEQADKWVERVYNQDAQYKYIGPYVEKGIDNLFMLQGKRDLHRKWWLAKRFSIFDAKYVSGTYKSQAIEVKCLNGTPSGQKFTIKAGYPIDYGYGINNIPRSFGISLNIGDYHTFTTQEVINLGDPLRIYGAPNLTEVDFSQMSDRLAVMNIASVYDDSLKTKLTKLVVGNANKTNAELEEISGLKQAVSLEHLDIQGMTKMSSLDLSNHPYFKTLKAKGSGISSISFAKGAPVETLELPSSIRVLSLNQLPYLDSDNIIFESISSLQQLNVTSCPNITDDFNFVYNWYTNKLASNTNCSLVMDGVVWENIDSAKFLDLCNIKLGGGELNLKGKISIPNATLDVIYAIKEVFGETSFYPNSELYIEVPVVLGIKSNKNSILEGESLQLTHELYPVHQGTFTYSIAQGREGCSINSTTGLLTTTEKAIDTSDVVVELSFVSTDGKIVVNTQKSIQVVRRTYPSGVTINGEGDLLKNPVFTWSYNNTDINGDFIVEWVLGGEIVSYYSIDSYNQEECVLKKNTTPSDTTSGILTINIKRNFDNEIVSSFSISLSHAIVWPTGATINGFENPVENRNYAANIEGVGITGVYEGSWALSGNIMNYVQIESQTNTSCVMKIIDAPIEFINGTLTYSLKKKYNGTILATATKSLRAIIEGVVITAKSNAPIQACLYEAGLVANEAYSLKTEVEKITANQLQPGSEASTSIFYSRSNEIEHFEEFEYFTSITTIKPYTFGAINGYENFKTIKLPPNLTSIDNYAFYSSGVQEVIFNNKLSTIGQYAFSSTNLINVTLPQSVTTIGRGAFGVCRYLELFDLSQTKITQILDNQNLNALKVVKLPYTVNTIGRWQFYSTYLSDIYCDAVVAPIAEEYGYSAFKDANNTLAGSSVTQSKRFLHIPFNATGYDDNGWETLTGTAKFNIYGKLTVTSNKSDAKFDVTYVTDGDIMKTINIGVGTVYINDIKYNTTITIAPKSLSGGYTWDKPSTSFTYTTSANSANFNAYIYPSNVDISGSGTIQGGNSATYTADITPSNFDIDVAYAWSLSKSSNASISPSGSQCTINTNAIEVEENFVLTCVVTTSDGKTLQSARTIKLITRPNFITAEYNVTDISSETDILSSYYTTQVSQVSYMEIDGVEVTPTKAYQFSSVGRHTVKITPTANIGRLFYLCKQLISVDFSQCDGSIITEMSYLFSNCSNLTSIVWGECVFPKVVRFSYAFCYTSLESINLSPFKGSAIESIERAFENCKSLKAIDLSPLDGAPLNNISYAFQGCNTLETITFCNSSVSFTSLSSCFNNCKALKTINWRENTVTGTLKLTSLYYNCISLVSIDFSVFKNANITNLTSTFNGCSSLKSINWGGCTFPNVREIPSMLSKCTSLTSIDLTPFEGAAISNLYSTFKECSSLETIDLSPLINATEDVLESTFYKCTKLKVIIAPWQIAIPANTSTFESVGTSVSEEKTLYVPTGATGYNTGGWLDPLCNPNKCGFTLSATF